jgi:hypothetical protein
MRVRLLLPETLRSKNDPSTTSLGALLRPDLSAVSSPDGPTLKPPCDRHMTVRHDHQFWYVETDSRLDSVLRLANDLRPSQQMMGSGAGLRLSPHTWHQPITNLFRVLAVSVQLRPEQLLLVQDARGEQN